MKLFTKKTKKQVDNTEVQQANDLNTQVIEDITKNMKKNPPKNIIIYIVLFGERPLTATIQGPEGRILGFTQNSKAEYFIKKYQSTFYCTKPLSILPLGSISELWAFLNNKSNDLDYESPYGLLINFDYSNQPFNEYSLADLKRIGMGGLKKELNIR